MNCIDINCDLGEHYGVYRAGRDEEIMPHVTSVNIACGYHAGDPASMDAAVALAKAHNVAVGAHPGLPDLMGFGRREMAVSPREAAQYVQYQLGALRAFCAAHGVAMRHVKPHGALYNMACGDRALARAIAKGIAAVDPTLILLALSGSELLRAGEEAGLPVASEVFADRGYRADGSLAPRGEPGAVLTDPEGCAARIARMVREGRVAAVTGEDIPVKPQSICVHGDTPVAVDFARAVRRRLEADGIAPAPLARVLEGSGV